MDPSTKCAHGDEIQLLRTELRNLRNQIRGLRAQHQKDITKLKQILSDPSSKSLENGKANEKNSSNVQIRPIGFASTWHHTKNGTPRQGVIAKMSNGCIDLSKCKDFHPGLENPQYALEGLENFSHIWILFHFHENSEDGRNFVKTKVAPPRLKGSKVGLFSTRSPHRPNPIGLTLAKLTRIEGCKVFLQGMDLLDQTPILDLKPYIPQYDIPKVIHPVANDYETDIDIASTLDSEDAGGYARPPPEFGSSDNILLCAPPGFESLTTALDEDQTPIAIPPFPDPQVRGIESVGELESLEQVQVPDWIEEQGLKISFTQRAINNLEKVILSSNLESRKCLKQAIMDVLQEDPRSNYR